MAGHDQNIGDVNGRHADAPGAYGGAASDPAPWSTWLLLGYLGYRDTVLSDITWLKNKNKIVMEKKQKSTGSHH